MSSRPSSTRSSFTLPAAAEVSVSIVPPGRTATRSIVPARSEEPYPQGGVSLVLSEPRRTEASSNVALLRETGNRAPARPNEVGRCQAEHRIRCPGGRPDLVERHQVLVDEASERVRVTEGGRPADREPGRLPDLVGVGLANVRGPGERGDLVWIHPVAARRQRQDRDLVRDEHERLHDLRDVASDRTRRVPGSPCSLREAPYIVVDAEGGCGFRESVGGSAHDATSAVMSPATSAATSSTERRASSNARSGPTRSTSERTVIPGGSTDARPQMTVTGTPASAAARITPSG